MENKKMGIGFGVMVLKEGKVLLGKRHVDPLKASSLMQGEGTWTMPGGKLEFGESFEGGAARELLEETGIKADEKDLKVISVTNDIASSAHFATVGLLFENCPDEPKVMEPDEITEWKWFPLDDLPVPVFPPSMKIIQNRKNGNFYTFLK